MKSTYQPTENLETRSFSIGQLARVTGIPAKAIRYYESIGLLAPPIRQENGYRCYSQVDVNRLLLLRRLRLLGISLEATRSLLIETSDARCAEVQPQVLSLIQNRLEAIDREITELHLLRSQVERYQQNLFACIPGEQETFRHCQDLTCLGLLAQIGETKEISGHVLSHAK
jgi:MerR family transcriptional regulator, copper efflux regulator